MEFSIDQVLGMAPDASSAAAGRKLAAVKSWQNLGRSAEAIWGECQGSAVYQVRCSLADLSYKCSCPSRKFPCKHVLGLLLVATGTPSALNEGEPPDWVVEWLGKREAAARQRETRRANAGAPVDAAAQAKRAEKRSERVAAGVEQLQRWLSDLARNGLAALETQPASFWEAEAARLVDAQAPGLAGRIRGLASVPRATPDWPRRLAEQLGRVALAAHAFNRLDSIAPLLREDVRQFVGWTLKEDEVEAVGERVDDAWIVIGQTIDDEERIRVQRNWLFGDRSRRTALVLQFAAGAAPFAETFVPGTQFTAEIVYYPSAWPQRARVSVRRGESVAAIERLPGSPSCTAFLDEVTAALVRQPWLDRFPAVLSGVVPAVDGERWQIQDSAGGALPLTGRRHWRLLALSGGAAVDLAGEWNGESLWPLGVAVAGKFHAL
ncbi:MAG TPA: SWIM zinc finger family protein [Pirellulales bacterium]|nr:SWIM zinc finger family protein [Pirellulales bacterium]